MAVNQLSWKGFFARVVYSGMLKSRRLKSGERQNLNADELRFQTEGCMSYVPNPNCHRPDALGWASLDHFIA